MADNDRPSAPGVIPAILAVILALVGITALPRAFGPSAPPAAEPVGEGTAKGAASETSPDDVEPPDDPFLLIAKPLIDFLDTGNSRDDQPKTSDGLERRLEDLQSRGPVRPQIRALIATVADPVRSGNSHRFDEMVDTIQRAAETQQYVLDRYRYPWNSAGAAAPGSSAHIKANSPKIQVESASPPTPRQPVGDPGVLLFRRGTEGTLELLLVILVPESPIRGVDKLALRAGLDLVDRLHKVEESPRPHEFRILGPCFTGSQTSIDLTLRAWCRDRRKRIQAESLPDVPCHILVYTGMATQIDQKRLTRSEDLSDGDTISFRATILENKTVVRETMKYLDRPDRVALLMESNTGFGQSGNEAKSQKLAAYQFPMHISQLRSSYEQRGLFDDREADVLRSAERIHLPFEELTRSSDLPASQTPAYSVAKDEQVLNQVMQAIGRGEYTTVGIVATDPRDVVFLAKRLRTFAPDVRIFTINSDLIYCHAQIVADLRGLYLGSCYPLAPSNQLRSYPFPTSEDMRISFSSDRLQGIYNAAILHLEEMAPSQKRTALREYGPPQIDPSPAGTAFRPPLWISRVGYGGIYPVHVTIPREDSPKALPYTWAAQRPKQASGGPTRLRASAHGDRRTWWVFCILLSLVVAGLLGISYWHFDWARGKVRNRHGPGPSWLASFLNWSHSEEATHKSRCRGPGLLLVVGQVLALVIYALYCAPMLGAVLVTHLPRWEIAGAVVVAVLLIALLAALGWTLAVTLIKPHRSVPARMWFGLAAVAAVLLGVPAYAPWLLGPSPEDQAASLERVKAVLAYERAMNLPSGLSPSFPALFLFIAASAWIYHGLRQRHVVDQLLHEDHPKQDRPRTEARKDPDATLPIDLCILRELKHTREQVEAYLHSPLATLWRVRSARRAVVLAVIAVLLFSSWGVLEIYDVLTPVLTHFELPRFQAYTGLIIFVLFVVLASYMAEFWWLWGRIDKLLKGLIRLPLTGAFTRLPTRVARWFSESPRIGGGRGTLIRRQATALVEHATDEVRSHLQSRGVEGLDHEAWLALKARLTATPSLQWAALEDGPVMAILQSAWKDRTVATAYQDAGATPGQTPENRPDRVAHEGSKGASAAADSWLEELEELVALVWLRWLSSVVGILWSTIGFLVLALVALILATSSFSFDFQERMLSREGILVVVLGYLIARVVIGLGRDEILSRLSNVTPGRMRLDGQLLTSLITALLPMLGLFAALSLDVSNTIRTLLDPILRYLM